MNNLHEKNKTYYRRAIKPGIIQSILLFLFITLSYTYPTYAQNDWIPQHPRLLFTSNEEIQVRKLIKENQEAQELARFLKNRADSLITLAQIPYEMNRYGNMLYTSRAYVERLGILALAYRLYGEKKYLNAAEQTLQWVCNYPNWDPKHYLDTAEMTTAVAIAYDWLYTALPASTKKLVKKSIYKNAISRVLQEYEKGGPGSWAKRETNWNVVCNTGMVLGALAVAEDYPQEARTILENAARFMPNCLKHFAPDGVCYEGPSYWGYTASYLSLYLKAVTDNGGDKGKIGQLPGIEHTALYYKRTLSPTGRIFNFANAHEEALNTPAFFLFSKLYHQSEVAEWYRGEIKKTIRQQQPLHQLFYLSLPWYDNTHPNPLAALPKLEVYHNSINDIIVVNGKRNVQGSIFLTAKGGEPMQAHQQMDCGTFVLESEGVRWTDDLGSDDYNLPGFWDYKPGGQRWKYFRNNNLSHNTISINHQVQYAAGKAFVCEEKTDIDQPYAKLDMTSLYKNQAESVFRTFTLTDDQTVEVKDEIKLSDTQSTVSWSVITKATVETNGNKAHLTHNGKHFYIQIVSPTNATFTSRPAQNTSPKEYPIRNTTILEANCTFDQPDATIKVRMSSRPFLEIAHGPYLQEVTTDGATFAFQTSQPSFSFIELKKEGEEDSNNYAGSQHGLKQADATFFAIRAEELQPNTTYQYRIHAKEIKSFQPYKVVFGDSIASPWYTFRTIDPKQKGGSIFITSDMHSNPKLLKNLLERCDYKTCTSFFYAGDMMNYMTENGEHPFTSFIDTSVEMFATSIPFEFVRGNHETRGNMARIFPSFFPKQNGKIYGSYLMGDVMVIMLDTGEDKSDNHPVYAGLTDFDNYRSEQARWLEKVVKSKEFKKAKYRIVISHFPLVVDKDWEKGTTWKGCQDASRKFLPILNRAGIDLIVAGHTHRFFYHEPEESGNQCPVLEQGAMCATRLDLADGNIHIKVIGKNGEILLDKNLK
ncbi:metallophosphoesterase [uncultured Mediterranea sp.]|uniref:metallophosphoesterase n=1 Tax=uncultured Mediterranea sp. TaxID=1926662 RepID=UPI0027D937DE|nr:metallophosphoesterase [uncultured Mediterranea sp.]